tara:strand:+ start:96 stop:521 length:426 start_codon:yes stop_codon:yes gene_type:complete
MPIKIEPIGDRGGPRGAMEASRNAAKAKKQKTIESLAKRMARVVPKAMSDQDLSRAFSIVRGMIEPPQAKKAGGKVKKAKGMAKGGMRGGAKKKMAKGGMRGGVKKKMAKGGMRGGPRRMMKNGGKAMKSKGMKRGGKAKR